MLEAVERALNYFADHDAEWWPFLFLRPETDQWLGIVRVAQLAVLYGLPIGLFANLLVVAAGANAHPAVFPVGTVCALFVLFQLTIAWAWNRRADRLVSMRARARAR